MLKTTLNVFFSFNLFWKITSSVYSVKQRSVYVQQLLYLHRSSKFSYLLGLQKEFKFFVNIHFKEKFTCQSFLKTNFDNLSQQPYNPSKTIETFWTDSEKYGSNYNYIDYCQHPNTVYADIKAASMGIKNRPYFISIFFGLNVE